MLCTSCYNNGYMLYAISRVILFLSYQVSNQYYETINFLAQNLVIYSPIY